GRRLFLLLSSGPLRQRPSFPPRRSSDLAEVDRRPDSIGKAIPNAEILVVRADGTRCEPGEVGELVHRGALVAMGYWNDRGRTARSEEHTSELQSLRHLVCRLLLEKKKKN